jgi:copper chaperone CopZ
MAAHNRLAAALARIACLVALSIAALVTVTLAASPPAAAQDTTETTLRVEGMYCSGCEATVRSVLTGLDGVTHAEADNTTETATVTYDPTRVSPQQMVQAINTNTYYQASVSDGASPARPSSAPPQNGGSIAIWAAVAALAAALATSVVFVRRATRGRPTRSTEVLSRRGQ